MTKITKKKFKLALVNSGGNQSTIAKAIEVTRGAITIFLSKNQDMRELLETEAERIIDVAENVIDHAIVKKRDVDVAKWKLSNSKRGKARGYGIKQELEHSSQEGGMIINLVEKSVEEIKRDKLNNQPEASADFKSS